MPTTINQNPRSLASLKLPRRITLLITYAQAIVKGMTNNASFPTPYPPLATVTTAVNVLQDSETAALARTKGAVAMRNEQRAVLASLLAQVRSYVQSIADANPENGPSIIESAGLSVKKPANRKPRIFSALPGATSGTVKIEAPSAGHRASYLWQYSLDGGKTWVDIAPTLQAKTSLSGLTLGSAMEVRYRWVLKTGASDWSTPVAVTVK
jgi:hypothetical protein